MSLATPIAPVAPVQAAAVAQDALARLLAGGVVDARIVQANAQGGLLRLMLASGALDLQADGVTLPPGTRVALQQTGADAQGRMFQIVPLAQAMTADAAAFSPRLQPFMARLMQAVPGETAGRAQVAVSTGADVKGQTAPNTPQGMVQPPAAQSPLARARELLMPLVRNALARQGGFAPLFANLEAAIKAPLQQVPFPVRVAIENVLALRLDPSQPDDLAEALKNAVTQSGIFQEAHLANGGPAPSADMKAQLLALRHVLAGWLSQEGAAVAQFPMQDHARLRPPLRGEMIQAQKPEHADIAADMKPSEVAAHLLAETESVLDRIRLMQFAGISDRVVTQPNDQQNRQWLTEIPIQMPNGTAVLPLAIERDGGSGAGGAVSEARVWRMRFTLETNELGPLDVTVALRGQHVDVRFWAERPSTAHLIEGEREALSQTLSEANLAVDAVTCQPGRRPDAIKAAPKKPGQFVDYKS
ncbi:MAG: flagellar hook-length control protein FliK [Beijerinckiaceae bacterium]